MELSDFAKTILFETTLDAKLVTPDGFSDERPGSGVEVPAAPGRPDALRLKGRGDTGAKVDFPAAHAMGGARERGVVLHFFANHELLAMELMALALLRFPDAPSGFRQGLARTIVEEQKHLALYKQRMEELGVGFGEVPVNRFFWDTTRGMRSPLDYLTEMSLTFEQANLDYSRHFRDLFAKVGDAKTAGLMDVVYREEIGHVKHGVIWFNRLRPGRSDDWDEYGELLPLPLSPVRAKGLGFDEDARRQAGLSERFIRELAVFQYSKGRPPVVYWFNPGCEAELEHPSQAYNPPAALRDVARDLGSLMQFLTRADDVVLVEKKPSAEFLEGLREAGLPIPQFIASETELNGRAVAAVEPWGQSPAALAREQTFTGKIGSPKRGPGDRRVFSKAYAAELLAEVAPSAVVGTVCRGAAEAARRVETHFAASQAPLVIKAGLGTSGRNMQRVRYPGMDAKQKQWLDNLFAAQTEVVVEPWLDRLLDLSVQLNVANGKKQVLGVTRFLTDGRGQYVGHKLGRKFHDLDPALRRALYEGGMLEELERTARFVAKRLEASGYTGPAGIDALVYSQDGAPLLKPIVEINPRYTMGRIALELDRFVDHAADAAWRHLNLRQVQALGHESFAAFARAGRERYPLVRKAGPGSVLAGGFVATNDPDAASLLQTVLLVGTARDMVPESDP